MYGALKSDIETRLQELRESGLYKTELVMSSAQGPRVEIEHRELLNLCANNYLALADDPVIVGAAHSGLDRWGYGMASVRFICGTQQLHRALEQRLSQFLGTDDTILFGSCYDANGGLFEALLDERDVVISDELNHASIIDGIRLSKARRLRYSNMDMEELDQLLRQSADARHRLIATDGVFSMDGHIAPLDRICELAERHQAIVMVDDSHAVGILGASGGGTPELHGVVDQVDILTGTLGKAIGGASGGYVSGRHEIVELLRQRARPYLFSNSLAPAVAAASLAALDLIEKSGEARDRLHANARHFRNRMAAEGFDILPGHHPIVPVMIGDEPTAAAIASRLVELGVYVVAFSYPVVPRGAARIRVQLSAAHTDADIEAAVESFVAARNAVSRDRQH
jgi:glycine C-acetyltransferase